MTKKKNTNRPNLSSIIENNWKELQQQSGVQMIPQDQFAPADKEELDLWRAEYLRLPEENTLLKFAPMIFCGQWL